MKNFLASKCFCHLKNFLPSKHFLLSIKFLTIKKYFYHQKNFCYQKFFLLSKNVKKFFFGVFPSAYVTRFITFHSMHSMMTETGARYPFIIMHVFCSNKKGTHCWSFLDLHPKKEIFSSDSFGFEGFKEFILQDDRKTLNKIPYRIKRFEKSDNKVTIITLTFSMNEYEKIKNANQLSTPTQDLFHIINELRKKHNFCYQKNFVLSKNVYC